MDISLVTTIFSVMTGVAEFMAKYGPGLLQAAENIVTDLKLAFVSATSGKPITADQQTQIDNALEAANNALSAALAQAEAQDIADGQATT